MYKLNVSRRILRTSSYSQSYIFERMLGAVLASCLAVAVHAEAPVGVATQCFSGCVPEGIKKKDASCCTGEGKKDKKCPGPSHLRCSAPAKKKPNIV